MRYLILISLFILFMYLHAAKTNRGKPLLHHDGYEYRQNKQSADGAEQFWTCTKKGCNGRIHTPISATAPVHVVNDHRHPRDYGKKKIREAMDETKDLAQERISGRELKPSEIWAHVIEDLSDEQKMRMPNYDAYRQVVQYQRWLPETAKIDRPLLKNVEIEGVYAKDTFDNQFLLYDSNDTFPTEPRFFIFASPQGLQRLKDYRNWAGDGTFAVAPNKFLQLYIVSVMIEHSSVACVYALLPNKKGVTYNRMFAGLAENLVGFAPDTFMTDFEKAATNGVEHTWRRTTQRLCYFHLAQSIMKHVKKEKLLTNYEANENVRKNVRSLAALSFLPETLVERGFNSIKSRSPTILNPIFTYFRRTYIRKASGNVLFPPDTWNHYQAVKDNLARTNNGQESFNRVLRSHFSNNHPPFSRLVNAIKAEDRLSHLKMENYRLNPANGPTLTTRKRKQKQVDKDIKELVIRMDEIRDPTDLQIYNHLVQLNWLLAKKNFDDWYPITEDDFEEDADAEEELPDSEEEREESSDEEESENEQRTSLINNEPDDDDEVAQSPSHHSSEEE